MYDIHNRLLNWLSYVVINIDNNWHYILAKRYKKKKKRKPKAIRQIKVAPITKTEY